MKTCLGNVVRAKFLENIKMNGQRDRTGRQGYKLKSRILQGEEPTNMKVHISPKND